MPEINISGVPVHFPFEPYPVQLNYMEKVIECLEKQRDGILESPTGTGKTLCLLCATMGWIAQQLPISQQRETNNADSAQNFNVSGLLNNPTQRNVPLVVYASRTHSQIVQAMKELKRSHYSFIRAGVVASRDHLCIQPDLENMSHMEKNYACNALSKKPKPEDRCCFRVDEKYNEESMGTILDIEDLDRIGREKKMCPFYLSKDMRENAHIIFMPYNYILDPIVRSQMKIELENAIIILDEGHNVEKVCEDNACTKIDSSKIRIAVRDLNYIIDHENLLKGQQVSLLHVNEVLKAIETLEAEILNKQIRNLKGGDEHSGDFMFSLLENANINEDSSTFTLMILRTLDQILFEESRKKQGTQNKCPDGIGIRSIRNFLTVVFSNSAPHLQERVKTCYKVYIEHEPAVSTRNNDTERPEVNAKRINFWCFSPVFGMDYLRRQNIRNLILTSGTLAPLMPIISEMEFQDPVQLTNPHIIRDFQIMVKVVGNGPNRTALNSSFKNRKNDEYLLSLGETIFEFSKVVPDGLLVFFPSYDVMNTCMDYWKRNGIWHDINQQKEIFVETKNELKVVMKGYYDKIDEPNSNGAIFMAVMRGKVSEGLDFADIYGRAVIICGIPYALWTDPKVNLKKTYLNTKSQLMSGSQWYLLDAIRAINQAIGRVIRHKDDYGAILFCDNRFKHKYIQKYLSSWIMKHLNGANDRNFDSTLDDLRNFYQNAKQKLPMPDPSPVLDYFDDEEEVSLNELLANADESDVMDDSAMMDYGVWPENQNNNNECSPSKRKEVRSHKSVISPFKRFKIEEPSTSYVREPPSASVPNVPAINELPKELVYHLGFIKDQASHDKYEKCIQTFTAYNDTENYEAYRDSMFSIFNEKKWNYILIGMVRYTHAAHKAVFERDINEFNKNFL